MRPVLRSCPLLPEVWLQFTSLQDGPAARPADGRGGPVQLRLPGQLQVSRPAAVHLSLARHVRPADHDRVHQPLAIPPVGSVSRWIGPAGADRGQVTPPPAPSKVGRARRLGIRRGSRERDRVAGRCPLAPNGFCCQDRKLCDVAQGKRGRVWFAGTARRVLRTD